MPPCWSPTDLLTYLLRLREAPHPAPTPQRKVLGSECVPPCSLEPSSLAWWSSPPSRLRFCTPCPLAAAVRPRLCAWPRTRASATRTTFPPRFAWSVTGVPLPRSAAPPHPTPEQHAAARSHGHTATTVTRSLALRARPIDSPAPHAPRRSLSPAPESGRSPGGRNGRTAGTRRVESDSNLACATACALACKPANPIQPPLRSRRDRSSAYPKP